jgi:hypothetical protein
MVEWHISVWYVVVVQLLRSVGWLVGWLVAEHTCLTLQQVNTQLRKRSAIKAYETVVQRYALKEDEFDGINITLDDWYWALSVGISSASCCGSSGLPMHSPMHDTASTNPIM